MISQHAVRLAIALWVIPIFGPSSFAEDNIRLLSAEEIANLERENSMWRSVKADQDVSSNLHLLRRLGYTDSEIEWFRPKLESVWEIPGARTLGILGPGVREKIADAERDLVRHYRNTQRFEEAGIRPPQGPLYTRAELNQMWRRAIMKALSYGEMSEYNLARSEEAKRIVRLTQGMNLPPLEQRELASLAREFGDQDNSDAFRRKGRDYLESRLEYYDSIRDLLGDERFLVFFERATDDFGQLRQILAGAVSSKTCLDLFWLRLKTQIALRKRSLPQQERQEICDLARQDVAKLLEPDLLKNYLSSEAARWLQPPYIGE